MVLYYMNIQHYNHIRSYLLEAANLGKRNDKEYQQRYQKSALDTLMSCTPQQIASIIYMSQRSSHPEDQQLFGDMILRLNGDGNLVEGAGKLWS
jgi:hypothetical protein